jgi:hypothetical protein
MRRVWAAVVSVWGVLAIVAVLAWTRPSTPLPQAAATPTVLVVKGKGASQKLVVLKSAAPAAHATTQTSPPR